MISLVELVKAERMICHAVVTLLLRHKYSPANDSKPIVRAWKMKLNKTLKRLYGQFLARPNIGTNLLFD